MSSIILHHYDASPFTQKALRVLGLKRLAWRSVQTPMLPPKDDLVALTGGYRGTPVMQIGADVYIDSQRIALEVESRHPAPTLFPGGDRGIARMLVKWSDAFFRTGLAISVNLLARDWPAEFREDRRRLFPDFDFDGALRDATHAQTQFRVHAGWLDAQLCACGPFLAGAAPGLADIQAHVFVWMARAYFPQLAAQLLAPFRALPSWEQAMVALGEGSRTEIDAATALAEARGAAPEVLTAGVDVDDPSGLRAGRRVEVVPDDTLRGGVIGELVALDWQGVTLRREDALCGVVHVHFPRNGYCVQAAA
jgi:glutathione S-transferase